MTTTGVKAFADTNVLLRALHRELPLHDQAKSLIFTQQRTGIELWISRQIIREYLVQATHPNVMPATLNIEQIEQQLLTIESLFRIADETAAVTAQLLALLKEFPTGGKQIHDANIVATMLTNGIGTLLTLNVEDMKRFSPKIQIITPS